MQHHYPEYARRFIVRMIFIVYWLLIFEGALRKWIFPNVHEFLFFLRDPFVVLIYLTAFIYQVWPRFSILLLLGIVCSGTISALLLIQLQTMPEVPKIVLLYGWRNYILYLPLVWVMSMVLKKEDLKRWVRYNLIVSLPIGILVIFQYYSSPSDWINRTLSEIVYTETGKYGGRIVRTIGTFTFFHGHQLYIGSMIAFVWYSWICPKEERPAGFILLWFATIATTTMFCLDFTRAPMYMATFVCLASVLSAFWLYTTSAKVKAVLVPLALLIFGSIFSWLVFSEAAEIRFHRILYGDSTVGRSVGVFSEFVELLDFVDYKPLGYGLGTTSRGGATLGGSGFIWAGEDEWRRIISESGPYMGLFYIFFRVTFVIWLFFRSIRTIRSSNNPLSLLLIAYIGPIFAVWYLTTIGSVHGYGWLFMGFCYAACQNERRSQVSYSLTF